jgi:hypothetical protein
MQASRGARVLALRDPIDPRRHAARAAAEMTKWNERRWQLQADRPATRTSAAKSISQEIQLAAQLMHKFDPSYAKLRQ